MAFSLFSKNGEILPMEQAVVPIDSIEYAYGFGVYETLRVKKGHALFVKDHLARLDESARILKLDHPFTEAQVADYISAFVTALQTQSCNIKMLLIGAPTREGATLYLFGSNPHYPEKQLYRDGVSVTLAHFERAFPHAKSLNMLQSYIAYRDAKRAGAYDALLIDRRGNITEGTRTNFFAMKGMKLYSPPAAEILLGVTRTHVIEVAKQNGYEIVETDIPLSAISSFDGAFLTSTSTKIMPISRLGDVALTIPESLRPLMSAFDAFHDEQ